MKGWNLDGKRVVLAPWQERAVRSLPAWDERETGVTMTPAATGAGKTVMLITAGRYAFDRAEASPLRDYHLREERQ